MIKRISAKYKNLILKFVLCASIGLSLSSLIGLSGSPSIAVTAILVTYMDRGRMETAQYCLRRVVTQVLMGAVVLIFIYLFHTMLSMPASLTSILVAAIGMPIGLTLDDWFHIAPMPATLGCSILIMATGIPGNYIFYFHRIAGCVMGVIVAYVVNDLAFKMRRFTGERREETAKK